MIDNITKFTSNNQLGNKGMNLLKIKKNGFNIPKTFVLDINFINSIFFIQNKKIKFKDLSILDKTLNFLDSNKKYIFRSSTLYEDSDIATFAGMFESVVSFGYNYKKSIFKVLNGYLGENVYKYAEKKGIKIDYSKLNIAILIQEFKEVKYAGVGKISIDTEYLEFSKNNNLSITSGKGKNKKIYIYDSKNKENFRDIDIEIDYILKELKKLKNRLYNDKGVLIEWLYNNNKIIFLQIRPLQPKIKEKNFTNDFLTWDDFIFYTKQILYNLGFKNDEWFLHMTGFSLNFKYFCKKIFKSPLNRTFTIFLFLNHNDNRIKDYIKVKNFNLFDVIRPKFGKEKLLDDLNSLYNIDYTFSILPVNQKEKFIFSENIGYYNFLKNDFKMNIFSFYNFETFKSFFDKNSGDYKNILENILRDKKIICFLIKNIKNIDLYNKNLLNILYYEYNLNNKILSYLKENYKNLNLNFLEIKGKSIFGSGMYEGIIVKKENIENFKFQKQKNYFYTSYDFEPFFIKYIDNIFGMIVSRGNYLCHAVAVCEEFGLPIITETSNINLLKTNDKVLVNFTNGNIKRI